MHLEVFKIRETPVKITSVQASGLAQQLVVVADGEVQRCDLRERADAVLPPPVACVSERITGASMTGSRPRSEARWSR